MSGAELALLLPALEGAGAGAAAAGAGAAGAGLAGGLGAGAAGLGSTAAPMALLPELGAAAALPEMLTPMLPGLGAAPALPEVAAFGPTGFDKLMTNFGKGANALAKGQALGLLGGQQSPQVSGQPDPKPQGGDESIASILQKRGYGGGFQPTSSQLMVKARMMGISPEQLLAMMARQGV